MPFFQTNVQHVRIIYKIVDHACRFPNIKFWVLHSTYINTCLGTPATPFIKTLKKKSKLRLNYVRQNEYNILVYDNIQSTFVFINNQNNKKPAYISGI